MIKENKTRVFLMLSGLLLLASWFYWFQYRPSEIRSYCDWEAKSKSYWRVTKSYDANYTSCLHEKGLK